MDYFTLPTYTLPNSMHYLHYDPNTGEIYKTTRKQVRPMTKMAKDGYKRVFFDGKNCLAHRVAFFIMTGNWPSNYIDHINHDRGDNRWSNLREATPSENRMNSCMPTNQKMPKGVKVINGKYQAYVTVVVNLGEFDDIELAELAAHEGREKYHGEFCCHI